MARNKSIGVAATVSRRHLLQGGAAALGAAIRAPRVFAADKVWTPAGGDGREQIGDSRRKWGVPRFDLMQVHNLVDWREHLETLFATKAAGEIGHIGITTSHGRRHELLERIMREYPLDFVQLTYNILDREPEERLLPLARDRGIAVMVNRPFRQKALIRRFEGMRCRAGRTRSAPRAGLSSC